MKFDGMGKGANGLQKLAWGTQGSISQLETGELAGTFDHMRAIAAALDVSLDDLVHWGDEA